MSVEVRDLKSRLLTLAKARLIELSGAYEQFEAEIRNQGGVTRKASDYFQGWDVKLHSLLCRKSLSKVFLLTPVSAFDIELIILIDTWALEYSEPVGPLPRTPGRKRKHIGDEVVQIGNSSEGLENKKNWEIEKIGDPKGAGFQNWYTCARYFARELVKNNKKLLINKNKLAELTATVMAENGVCKRGGKVPFQAGTVLKAFVNVDLG
ncbi:hypothetical protein [Duganella sp. Root1480D1]|uniref:hypothetical protein n=1 Tax=Duganella sp. Root1480D1 TaxID=1736471 RepID=UPI000A59355E|nr:hypothetical protein [Duganella sp. Root1480D1]